MCPNLLFTYACSLKAVKQIHNYHAEPMSFAHTGTTGPRNLLKKLLY